MRIRKKTKKKLTMLLVSLIILIIMALCIHPEPSEMMEDAGIYPEVGEGISVNFIDVGKADCIYINADGYNLLIDAGLKKDAEEITSFLDRYSIDSFDMVIATHPDADHIGGMSTIVDTYEIQKYVTYDIDDKYDATTKTYYTLLETLDNNNVDITYTTAGDKYTFGAMLVEVISPDHEYKDSNDDSVVVRVTYGESEFLFTGDASSKVEKYILENNVDVSSDVIKISHHGSKTATTEEFLSAVDPEIAIVPVGENIYNLPNVEVIKRLENYGLDMYRSDFHGTITVNSDGKDIQVTTEK